MRNENEILKSKNEWLKSSLSIFSCGQKSFEMILASQKCVFDKQRLRFKSSKNQKYFKIFFVKESTSASLPLLATFVEEEDVEEEKPSEEDDDLALITRKLNKYMRGERFRGRKFTFRRDLSKKESSSHGDKDKWEEKRDLVCFKCKKSGHIKYDCPLYKSEAKRRMKKTMIVT